MVIPCDPAADGVGAAGRLERALRAVGTGCVSGHHCASLQMHLAAR